MRKEEILRQTIPTINDIPTKYRPEGSWLMVKNLPSQGVSEGGIILPDQSQITYNEGHIVAKGPLVHHDGISLGDCITWNSSSAYEFETEGVKFSLVKAQDILMRIPVEKLSESKQEGVCEECGSYVSACTCIPKVKMTRRDR